jgi:hypothetical protein
MTNDDLEAFTRRWLRAICEGTSLDSLLGGSLDPAQFAERAAAARARLGTMEGSVDDLVREGDRIAWRWTLRGQNGSLRGVNFQRVVAGRAVEHWTIAA